MVIQKSRGSENDGSGSSSAAKFFKKIYNNVFFEKVFFPKNVSLDTSAEISPHKVPKLFAQRPKRTFKNVSRFCKTEMVLWTR